MIPEFKLVMFATSDIAEYATLAAEINRRYCTRHGYAFCFEQYDDLDWHPCYEKVRVLQRHLGSAKYLLWIDADACVINFSQTLSEFCDNGNDFIIAGHQYGFDLDGRRRRFDIDGVPCGLNTGTVMFRSSGWTASFLKLWEEKCQSAAICGTPFADQGPLQKLLMDNALDIQAHANIVVPASRFNRDNDDNRDVCEFVLHLWGAGAACRKDIFAEIEQGRLPELGITVPKFDLR